MNILSLLHFQLPDPVVGPGRSVYQCIESMSQVTGLAPIMLPISGEGSCGDSLQHLVKEQQEVMADFVAFVLGGGDEEAVDDDKALALMTTCMPRLPCGCMH
jgi:hypothetical protein